MIDSAENARPFAAPKVAAGAIFFDERDRIMLVRPTYKPYWDVPGGYVEQGESPLQACVREVAEELGLRLQITTLLTVDWAPHPDEGDKMLFLFDGGRLASDQLASIAFRDGEISEFTFVDDSQLDGLTIPRLARRIRATVQARRQMRTTYLEQGASPGSPQISSARTATMDLGHASAERSGVIRTAPLRLLCGPRVHAAHGKPAGGRCPASMAESSRCRPQRARRSGRSCCRLRGRSCASRL